MNSNFTENEIITFERWDKKKKKNVVIKYPVVGGRLRLYHEDLKDGGISIEVVEYENDVAVIKATVDINGNTFNGIGMASKSRDSLIFPAILEMAETRAIARALRFAGYGVEYTGAEEMQGVKNFDDKSTSEPSEPEQTQDVNDDMTPDTGASKGIDNVPAPTLKRQVWEYVTSENAGVQENYLAEAMKEFVATTAEKYDGNVEHVYELVLDNKEIFLETFARFVKAATPEIKAATPDPEPKDEPDPEQKKELKENLDKGAAKMKIAPAPPVVDEDKVKKANIYRAMPDGVSVAALNGTLATLLEENSEHSASDIYDMVLGDIEGFVAILEEWSKKNNIPSGVEVATVEETKEVVTDKEFRKSWVRLDWDNFGKFIIQNSDRFKASKEEYTMAVAKFDRLKAKVPETKDLTFPYLFSYDDAKITTKDSVIIEEEGQELGFLRNYQKSVPAITARAADHLKIDPANCSELEASMINEQIEAFATEYEKTNGTPYMEG